MQSPGVKYLHRFALRRRPCLLPVSPQGQQGTEVQPGRWGSPLRAGPCVVTRPAGPASRQAGVGLARVCGPVHAGSYVRSLRTSPLGKSARHVPFRAPGSRVCESRGDTRGSLRWRWDHLAQFKFNVLFISPSQLLLHLFGGGRLILIILEN